MTASQAPEFASNNVLLKLPTEILCDVIKGTLTTTRTAASDQRCL